MAALSTTREFEAIDALVDELRNYIERIQHPRPGDPSWTDRVRAAGQELSAKMAAVAASAGDKHATTRERLRDMSDRLHAYTEALAESPNAKALKLLRERLSRSYEEVLLELKERRVARAAALAQSRQLKPTNYARNLFHAAMGMTGVTLYYLVLSREGALLVLGTIFAVFGTLEVTRRFSDRWNDFLVDKVFGAIARPSERYRVNSATIYLVSLLIIVWLFPKDAVLAAVLVLGFSDPVASLVGKRWGKRKLFRDKSYAGTAAFFVTGVLAVGILLAIAQPGLGALRIVGTASAIAAVGAVTELLSSRIDDNFTIPVACAAFGALLL